MATLEVSSFDGGLTDSPIGAEPNKYQKADNLVLTDEGILQTRQGSGPYEDANVLLYASPIFFAASFESKLIVGTVGTGKGRLFYHVPVTGWVELLGPTSLAAWDTATDPAHVSHTTWQSHLVMTSDQAAPPLKAYLNESSALTLVTAGLPYMNTESAALLAACITLANEIRADLLTHFALVGAGSHLSAHVAAAAALTHIACTNEATLLTLIPQLIASYRLHDRDGEASAPTFHQAKESKAINDLYPYSLSGTLSPETLTEARVSLNDLRLHVQRHFHADEIHGQTGVFTNGYIAAGAVPSCPAIADNYARAFTYANELKAKINAHLAVTYHNVADTVNVVTSADATDLPSLLILTEELVRDISYHIVDALGSLTYHEELGVTSVLLTVETEPGGAPQIQAFYSMLTVADVLLVLKNIADTFNIHTLDNKGIAPSTHKNVTSLSYDDDDSGLAATGTYIYSFHYFFEYEVTNTTYQDAGPVVQVAYVGDPPDFSQVSISDIPVITNAAYQNYATAAIKVKVYRTTDGGTTSYYVGELTNGTTTFTDTVPDDELVTRELLYTSGGVLDNDPPPLAKYVHVAGDYCYYGNIDEDGDVQPSWIRQSVGGDVDSCPVDNYVALPAANTGISSVKKIPIAFTATGTYRLEGHFDEQGNGGIEAVAISDRTGCLAGYAIVQVDGGVIFASEDGWYFTDGYQLQEISSDWKTTYRTMVSATKGPALVAAYDNVDKRIWVGANTESSGSNNKCMVLNMRPGMKPNSAWTSASGGANFTATALCFHNGALIRGTGTGHILAHGSSLTSDRFITASGGATWIAYPIKIDYWSVIFDFGSSSVSKWVTRIVTKLKDVGNSTLQITSVNDLGKTTSLLAKIVYRGANSMASELRRFTTGSLRCTYKQIKIASAPMNYDSTTVGGAYVGKTATISAGSGTLKILTLVGINWPTVTINDATVTLSHDAYVASFSVTAQNGTTTLTVNDPGGALTAAAVLNWALLSYPTAETTALLDYTIGYQTMTSNTQGDAAGEKYGGA